MSDDLLQLTDTQLRERMAVGEAARKELNRRLAVTAVDIERRIDLGEKFDDAELVYSAYTRCRCGAGMAYVKGCSMHSAWRCSDVLTHRKREGRHDKLAFVLYEVKSENQPSAGGLTTRPK